ncbi:proline-rich transmembrane protein 1-like [Ptychodera flava]|uniref:proline-rich transmembrane protein 1-like n=1 Tax=Ptychodera flava TaxID=63121 RepID=UPI003969FCD0
MSEKQELHKEDESEPILKGQPVVTSPIQAPPPYMYNQPMIHTSASPAVVVQPSLGSAPPDHLALAIFATVCCFWPTGIFAILRASDARSAAAANDLNRAWDYANKARKLSWISIGIGIAIFMLVLVFLCVEYLILIPLLLPDLDHQISSTTATPDLLTSSAYI